MMAATRKFFFALFLFLPVSVFGQITDNFNRVDGGLGSGWETTAGTAWTISSNAAKPVSQYTTTTVRRTETFSNDHYAQVRTEAATGVGDITYGAVAVRVGATGDGYLARLYPGELSLYKRVGGANTYLSDAPVTASGNTLYTLKLDVSGTTITAYFEGVQKIQVTDSAISSGNPGLGAFTGQTSLFPRFDDFECSAASGGGGGNPRFGDFFSLIGSLWERQDWLWEPFRAPLIDPQNMLPFQAPRCMLRND